jgi:hypothetical protein
MTFLAIDLDLLNAAECCDLTNARPRAAWSAPLEETRVLRRDLLTVNEAAAFWEETG